MLLARCAVPHGYAEAREALTPFACAVRELLRLWRGTSYAEVVLAPAAQPGGAEDSVRLGSVLRARRRGKQTVACEGGTLARLSELLVDLPEEAAQAPPAPPHARGVR